MKACLQQVVQKWGKYENNSNVDGSGVYGGDGFWLFLFKNCYEMIQDIRSGTRKVPVIRKAVDKYDDCCKLEIAVNNTEVFVEKIIENEKICGLA